MSKKGIFVVFEGTDGSGKSTIIDAMPEVLKKNGMSYEIKYYHWRPGLINSPKKKSNNCGVVTEPHKKKPYGRFLSFLKFVYFNLDYIFGYLFLVKPQLKENNIVIFDRYYYDYFIDKYRYRLDISDRCLVFFSIFIKKPDITFLLIGTPQVLFNRKHELSVREIERQIQRLKTWKSKFSNPIIINVDNPIEKVVNDVVLECKKLQM